MLSFDLTLLRPRTIRLVTATAAVAAIGATALVPAGAAVPAAPKFPSSNIEVFAPYQPQTLCDPTAKRGVVKFRDLVMSTYGGTGDYGITRACSIGGRSEHKEGRAWDWKVSVNNPRQVRQVHTLFHWLFATDKYGNKDAMLRRLGIMYMIWDKRIWNAGGWDGGGWSRYSCQGFTGCHKNHVHFSFGWAGALGKTSFWTGKVSPVLPGPGRLLPDRKLPKTIHVAPTDAVSWSPFSLEKRHRYRMEVSGTYTYGAENRIADAECTLHSDGTWRRRPEFANPELVDRLDLTVNRHHDWRPVTDDGHGCSADEDHAYVLDLRQVRTKRLRFLVKDPVRLDDYGNLSVVVRKRAATA